jgi:histone H2A
MSGKGKGKGGKGGKLGGKQVSRSSKAGLMFPVGRIGRFLKQGGYSKRIGGDAPVFMAAIMEYIAAEVFELSGKAARDNKKSRITARHLKLAIANDKELQKLLGNVTINNGGVLPHVNPKLVPIPRVGKGKKGKTIAVE